MTNKQFLQSIYDTVKSLGIVQSQYEFGYLCGRDQSWFSCAKSVDRQMSIGAMVALAVSLQNLPPERVSRGARPHVKKLVAEIWKMIEAQGSRQAAWGDPAWEVWGKGFLMVACVNRWWIKGVALDAENSSNRLGFSNRCRDDHGLCESSGFSDFLRSICTRLLEHDCAKVWRCCRQQSHVSLSQIVITKPSTPIPNATSTKR